MEDPYDLFKVGPVQVQAVLKTDVDIDFYTKVGYDTRGLRTFFSGGGNPAALANGFYVDASRDLLKFKGSVAVTLAAPIRSGSA